MIFLLKRENNKLHSKVCLATKEEIIMNRKLFKLPILTSIGGIIFYLLNFILAFLGFGGIWTPRQSEILSYIPLILSVIILIIIGMILRRTFSRKDFIESATLLVIYSIIILIVQKISLYFDIYNETIDFILYIPTAIFQTMILLSTKFNNSKVVNSIFLILSLLEPYIIVFFGYGKTSEIV